MRRSLLKAATVAAILIAALVANLRLAGTSPIAWIDTFNDEIEVQQCVANDSCTLVGMSTSVPGLVAAVAWLDLRTLLAWLGVGLSGAHLFVLVLNALTVVLVFHLATQLGGQLAGAAAVWILMADIGALGVQPAALHNISFLPFLGAVFVLACTAVVERPGATSVTLAALVGAVMANVHLAGIMTAVSVVWVALLAPRRRFLLAALAAVLFVLATVAMAPPAWLHNLSGLLQHDDASRRATNVMTWQSNQLIPWALFATGAWVVSLVNRAARSVAYRRRSQGALAVMIPFLAAFLLAPRFGVDANAKYLAHLRAACAVAAALPLALVAGALLRAAAPRRLVVAVERVLPFVVALVIAVPGVIPPSLGAHLAYFKRAAESLAVTADDQRTPTVGDLVAVHQILHDEYGWDVPHMLEGLKSPYGFMVLTGLPLLGSAGNASSRVRTDVASSVILMVLGADELPDPLPSNWRVVRRSTRAATVLIFMQSCIDWSKFEVCLQPADGSQQPCAQSSWQFADPPSAADLQNMPPAGPRSRGRLTLRLPLRPKVPESTKGIFMPRMREICAGHIASVSDGALQVDTDRRHATLSVPEPGQASPATIDFEWQIGAAECDGYAYDGLPPFVIEGDAATVQRLEAILRKREG